MIKSQRAKHREADQSDKHCIVNGVENLMVDGRGKCRPFGLEKPKSAPTLEVDESGGELRRDAGYSYCYAPYDSYHNAEGEPSPATEFIKPGSDTDYKTVSFGFQEENGDFNLSFLRVSGTNLSKINGYYIGQCIAVLIENDDRPTPYSQWQYRKITNYEWNGQDEVGEFTVSRPFINVDTDPEDQQYQVRLSDMDMEEGEVGGKSAGNRKLILDPNASTDTASYRMKVIRIVQGVGKGQSRFIVDAALNSLGQVEITVDKPWKKKPKFVDPALRQTQEKQSSLTTRKDAKPKFFNQNWSSSYVISDPLRFNGLCFDGEVEARDKKTGRITISGLGVLQSILTGNVIRFIQSKSGEAKIVISLENANTDTDWTDESSLLDKRLRITSGPGAGKEYVITGAEASGTNSVKLTLGIPKTTADESTSVSGVPTAKSTYVIYTADAESTSDLLVKETQNGEEIPIGTEEWASQKNEVVITDVTHSPNGEQTYEQVLADITPASGDRYYLKVSKDVTNKNKPICWLSIVTYDLDRYQNYNSWIFPHNLNAEIAITPYAAISGERVAQKPWQTTVNKVEVRNGVDATTHQPVKNLTVYLDGWPYWIPDYDTTGDERVDGYENYINDPLAEVKVYERTIEPGVYEDDLALRVLALAKGAPYCAVNIASTDKEKYTAISEEWVGSLISIYPYATTEGKTEKQDPWTTKVVGIETYNAYNPGSGLDYLGYSLKLEGWPYWLEQFSDKPAEGYENYSDDPLAEIKIYNQEFIGDPSKITFASDWKGNVTITVKDPKHELGETVTWEGKRIDITPIVGYTEPYEEGEVWKTTIRQGFKTTDGYNISVDGWPYWFKKGKAEPKKGFEEYAWQNRLWSVTLWDSAIGVGQASEDGTTNLTKIYISDKTATGIYESDGQGGNKIAVNGLYTASFQVASEVKKDKKQYKATISRFVRSVGTDDLGDYIELIGLLPRLYDKPTNPSGTPVPSSEVSVMLPVLESQVNIYGANSRDGYYTGWRAVFINTTEIGGNKQRLKCKEARVIASFDATGEIIVDKEIAGVKPGWQVVLYSEYTSCFGSCVNAGERSQFYRKGKADYGVYDEFVPLEPFASSDDDTYNGWTLEVLAKGKTKKDGSTKYTKTPSRYRNKQRRTVVDYYGSSRRAYVYAPYGSGSNWHELDGQPFDPKLKGNEFIWLYDPSTSIEKMFDEESDDSVSEDFGVKIKVKGIKRCSFDGVDKIRLYRAAEATGAYHLVVELENKDQDYVDNIPEEHLGTEINLDHVPPPPCSKVCEYKGRFILGGAIENHPQAYLTKGGHMSSFIPDYGDANNPPNPLIENYLYTDGKTFTGRALRVTPAIGVLMNQHSGMVIPQRDDTNTEKIKVGLAITEMSGDGVVAWCERRQFSGVFQRSRVPAGTATAEPNYKAVEHVFLATSTSGKPSDYKQSVLTFTGKNYDDGITAFQTFPFYVNEDRTRFNPLTKEFVWSNDPTATPPVYVYVPTLSNTVYPLPFQIRTALWVIYRKDGKYYLVDSNVKDEQKRIPKEVHVEENNGITFLVASVNQGENFNNLSYHIGGNAAQAVTGEMFYSGSGDYPQAQSASFRLIAANFGLENEDIVSCYLGADAEQLVNQEPASYKPVLTIPECIENSSSASVYTDTGEPIVDPAMKATHAYNGQLVWLVVWDKEYTGQQLDGAVALVARDNAKAIFVTAATDGDVEKTTLETSFVLNDGYGTDVTAIATWLDNCYVFKQRGIYAFDPDNIQLHIVSNDIGCIATDSMARGRSGLYWLAEGRRFMRANFVSETSYIGASVQPWLDGYKDFDGWYVDKDHLTEMLATYDVEKDEYITFIPAIKGNQHRLICLCFCDERQSWYRVDDDNLHSDNAADCAFRFEGGGALAGANGIWINKKARSGYAAWRWKSIQRDEGNSSYIKHVKRMQIINVVDESILDNPTATFKFYKEMRTTPEGSYQARDAHTGRVFYTNKFSQLVHIGLRALMWQFEFYGSSYVKLHSFTLQYRSKGESEVEWGSTPN